MSFGEDLLESARQRDRDRVDAARWRVLCRNFGNERDDSTPGKQHDILIRLNADGCEVLNPDGSLNFSATLAAIMDDEARIQAAAGVPEVDPFDFPEDHDPATIAARRAWYAEWCRRQREKRAAEDAADGVSLVDGESFSHQTPIPSPMDSEREG